MILRFGAFSVTGGGYSISESRHGFGVNMPPGCPNPNTNVLYPTKKLSVPVSVDICPCSGDAHDENGKCDIVCEAILAMRGAKKYSRWQFWVL